MRVIAQTVAIEASPDQVWKALVGDHAGWDPHIESISGEIQAGEKLAVRFRNGMTFKPTVTVAEPGVALEWLGRLGVPGLFDGRHRWDLESMGDRTRVTQSEEFTGVLVPMMGRVVTKADAGFAASNAALSDRLAAHGT